VPEPPAPAPEPPAPEPPVQRSEPAPEAPEAELHPPIAQVAAAEAPAPEGPTATPSERGRQMPSGDDVDWSGWISPVVQMLAEEHGVDLAEVRGTGIGGRIRKRDVLRHAQSQ
jgi:2-oxoglutarate dehydrogenase E2 component (dihydrolipoamide succinyltransferase)